MQQEVFNKAQLTQLKQTLSAVNAQRVFVVRANKSYAPSGAEAFVKDILGDTAYDVFFDFDPNPQVEDLRKGIERFKQGAFDLIIAIGGGSVLDMAKLISIYAHQSAELIALIEGKESLLPKKTPLLAVPTTSGTGAEVTHFAVLYNGKMKYSVANELVLPNWVYLSPEFSKTASSYLTACTGLDAFCQAIESVWCVNATDESQAYALEAIELIWNNISFAVHDNSLEAKESMQKAAYLAGKAINVTKTTAPHAISYAFSSYYGLPHGHAVALSLPFFMSYNYSLNDSDCTDKQGADAVKLRMDSMLKVLNLPISQSLCVLYEFIQSLGVETRISKLIPDFNPNLIIDNVNTERLGNNPRLVNGLTIKTMLNQIS